MCATYTHTHTYAITRITFLPYLQRYSYSYIVEFAAYRHRYSYTYINMKLLSLGNILSPRISFFYV